MTRGGRGRENPKAAQVRTVDEVVDREATLNGLLSLPVGTRLAGTMQLNKLRHATWAPATSAEARRPFGLHRSGLVRQHDKIPWDVVQRTSL